MKIRIMCIGTLKESYWREAEKEYVKRITPYASVSIEEFPDLPTPDGASTSIEEGIKNKEGEKLLAKIKSSEFVCVLDLNKKEPDSIELSKQLEDMMRRGGSSVTFIIGGSLGVSEAIRARANASISLSRLTFTHQMTRVILLEQIYRGFKILNHEPYHK